MPKGNAANIIYRLTTDIHRLHGASTTGQQRAIALKFAAIIEQSASYWNVRPIIPAPAPSPQELQAVTEAGDAAYPERDCPYVPADPRFKRWWAGFNRAYMRQRDEQQNSPVDNTPLDTAPLPE